MWPRRLVHIATDSDCTLIALRLAYLQTRDLVHTPISPIGGRAMRAQGLGLVVAVAVASVNSFSAEAAVTYTFQKVAETGANYSSLGAPTVNDLGVLAFQGVAPANGRGV